MSLVLKCVDTPSLEECFVHLQSERKKIRFCESQDFERLCVSLCANIIAELLTRKLHVTCFEMCRYSIVGGMFCSFAI